MKKGFIFDLDGVICFTDKYHYLAWKKLADREGIYFDETINNKLRGVSRMDSLEIILEKANRHYKEEEKLLMAAYKNEVYLSFINRMTSNDCPKEVIEVLKALKGKGFALAIGSSSKNTQTIIDRLGIRDLFDVIVDGNKITKTKPNPEVFLKAAERLGLSPSECYVVEDAESGIDAAKSGGFESIGIGEASSYAKTDHGIERIEDILTIVK